MEWKKVCARRSRREPARPDELIEAWATLVDRADAVVEQADKVLLDAKACGDRTVLKEFVLWARSYKVDWDDIEIAAARATVHAGEGELTDG